MKNRGATKAAKCYKKHTANKCWVVVVVLATNPWVAARPLPPPSELIKMRLSAPAASTLSSHTKFYYNPAVVTYKQREYCIGKTKN